MSEKAMKDVDHHGKWCEGSNGGVQQTNRKQHRYSKDKRYSQPSRSRSHSQNSGSRLYNRPSSNQRWKGQRDKECGVTDYVDNLAIEVSPSTKPGGDDKKTRKPTPVSLNHLLNFTFAPMERSNTTVGGAPTLHRRRRSRNGHSYNKEQFLQANCQFVVTSSGDYSVHSADPDKLVEWETIEQVRLLCHQIPSCPICLYPPRAAKITRCGHVFCWSCILHYLALSEHKWRKCPICHESIYRSDLKSVTALANPQYHVGDTVTMTLMMREKGTTTTIPKSQWSEKAQHLQTLDEPSTSLYVKLLSASAEQVLQTITSTERKELECQLSNIGPDELSEKCFIETALEDLRVRETRLKEMSTAQSEVCELVKESEDVLPSAPACSSTVDDKPWATPAECYYDGEFESAFSDLEEEGESSPNSTTHTLPSDDSPVVPLSASPSSSEPLTPKTNSSAEGSPVLIRDQSPRKAMTAEKYTYFYQASDGQHVYLHPVNARCLLQEYGGLEHSPEHISATIVEMEQLSMTEDVRSRYRYLSHLPLTCEFVLCELELKPPLVSRQTLRDFSDELQRRRQKRTKKRKEEKRRERRAEDRSSKPEPMFRVPTSAHELTPEKFHDFLTLASSPPLPSVSPPKPHTPSHGHTVTPTQPHTPTLMNNGEKKVNGFVLSERNRDEPVNSNSGGSSDTAPSFAQALRGKPPPSWPIKSPPKPPASTVTVPSSSCVGEDENELSVPAFQDAFNEALISASASVLAAQNASEGKPGGRTTKKGRKKLVLFSTGGARGAN